MLSASVSAAAALYHSDRSGDIFQQSFLRGVPVYDKEKGYTTVVDVSPLDRDWETDADNISSQTPDIFPPS